MKNLFVAIIVMVIATMVLIFAHPAKAAQITLTDPTEEITTDGKMCIYENSQITKITYVGEHSKCPYAKNFRVEDDDE